jgi:hypothetical protein
MRVKVDWLWVVWAALHASVLVCAAYVVAPVVVGPDLLHVLIRMPTAVVVLVALLLLILVVGRARGGDPFTAANVRLLRILGGVVLAGGMACDVVAEFARRAVDPASGGFVWTGWWLAGLGFLAVSEVFARGVRLRTELDAVI